MAGDLDLRRKWTFRSGGRRVVFVKKPREKSQHVFSKALLWALYLPQYPDLAVEIPAGDRYRPDVVALGPDGSPRFWGEAGRVGRAKIGSLARRYPATHLAIAKWDQRLDPFEKLVREALDGVGRAAPFDLVAFPGDSPRRFIDERGEIRVRHGDLEWVRFEAGGSP